MGMDVFRNSELRIIPFDCHPELSMLKADEAETCTRVQLHGREQEYISCRSKTWRSQIAAQRKRT